MESKEVWTPYGTPVFCGGDPPAPTAVESTREMLRGYEEGLPGFLKVTRQEAIPTAEAAYELSKRFAPLYSQLQTQLYGEEGRELNRIGREIARENALAQAATDAEVLRGAGRELVREAHAAQREVDPEFFATREAMGRGLAELLSGRLTGGEEEALRRATQREAVASGVTAPTAFQTAAAATRFGEAAHNKLANALALATGALPTMRTGVDVLMQTVGRPSQVNTGDSRFMGVTPEGYGNQAYQFGGNLLNQIGENQRAAMQINANRRDTLDRILQVQSAITEGVKSAASMVGGMMCHILHCATDLRLPFNTIVWINDRFSHKEARGYKNLATVLVPLMIKYKSLKYIVKKLVAEPTIRLSFGEEKLFDSLLYKTFKRVCSFFGKE